MTTARFRFGIQHVDRHIRARHRARRVVAPDPLVRQHFLVNGPFALAVGRFNVEFTSSIGRMREGRRGLQTTGSVTIQPDLRGRRWKIGRGNRTEVAWAPQG
jgi:hypothetical protein